MNRITFYILIVIFLLCSCKKNPQKSDNATIKPQDTTSSRLEPDLITEINKDNTKGWIKRSLHNDHVINIITNNKNELAASLSQDGILSIWQTTNGKDIYSLDLDKTLQVSQFAFSHNGKYLVTIAASLEYDPESPKANGGYRIDSINVSLWQSVNGKLIKEYIINQDEPPHGIGFTLDDNFLLVRNLDRIQTYDIESGQLTRESHPYTDGDFSPQSNYSVCPAYHRSIGVWNIPKDTLLFEIKTGRDFTRTVSFPYDEKFLVSTGQDDSTLKIWEMPTGTLLKTIRLEVPQVGCGNISPSGKYFAGGSITGEVNIWDLSNGKIIQTYNDYHFYIWSVAWSPDEKQVFVGYQDGTIIGLNRNKPD